MPKTIRKILYLIAIALLILVAYLTNEKNKILNEVPTDETITEEIGENWILYESPQHGFIMAFPDDFDHETIPEGERFLKLGPTQSLGTELYDGISILITSGSLGDKTFEQLVDMRYNQEDAQEANRSISEKRPATIGDHTGISFDVFGFGDGTFTFLPMPDNRYLEIINMTVEPSTNSPQTYQKLVNDVLGTITF